MESALEEIEFLALSPNRVEVLVLLAAGPHTRSALQAETGASQATLGRILGDFQERSWVTQDGSEYAATATGRLVAEGFTDLLDIVETERDLRGIVEYLPAEALTFDLRHLADATITTPSGTRPNAPVQRLLDIEREATEVQAFSHAFNEQNLTLVTDRVEAGDLSFSGVFSRSAIDALAADSDLRRRLGTLMETPGATLRIYDGAIPVAATVADDTVHLLVRDDDGILRASIDSTAAAVREWAQSTFEEYWTAAAPLSASDLEP